MTTPAEGGGRGRRAAILLAMAATVAASVVAGLASDAGSRADVATRRSQELAVQASGELQRQGMRSDYDLRTLSSIVEVTQEANLLHLTALERRAEGEPETAEALEQRAALAEARAARLTPLSILLTDPAYAPAREGDPPDLQAHLSDSVAEAERLVELQNQAADDRARWDQKADAYTTILALISMALFLFGLAQAAQVRNRTPLVVLGSLVLGLALVWAMSVILQ